MITTKAMPAPLPAHHRRVAPLLTTYHDFADPLGKRVVALTPEQAAGKRIEKRTVRVR